MIFFFLLQGLSMAFSGPAPIWLYAHPTMEHVAKAVVESCAAESTSTVHTILAAFHFASNFLLRLPFSAISLVEMAEQLNLDTRFDGVNSEMASQICLLKM